MIDAGAPVEVFDEIDSTVLEARRRAERSAFGPVWLVAKRQTAGRGRRGRIWATIDGNLLATYFFTTRHPPATIALLGFATGIALAETIDAVLGRSRATLKWPNDVFLDGAKACGILLDSGSVDPQTTWVALAFGVNLAGAPDGLDQSTISLRDVLPPDAPAPAPLDFLAALRPRLERWSAKLEQEGFEPLRRAWMERAHGLGQDARVLQGEQVIEGAIVGLSSRGELELDTLAGRRLIAAGDVFLTRTA